MKSLKKNRFTPRGLPLVKKVLGLDEPYLTTNLDQKFDLWLKSFKCCYYSLETKHLEILKILFSQNFNASMRNLFIWCKSKNFLFKCKFYHNIKSTAYAV